MVDFGKVCFKFKLGMVRIYMSSTFSKLITSSLWSISEV